MTHTPIIVETKELDDEQVAYRVRCRGDPLSDSWHTMMAASLPDHESALTEVKTEAALRHEAKVAWREAQSGAVTSARIGMHTVEVVETREAGNESVSYRIRCCGDDTTNRSVEITLFSAATKDAPSTWPQELNDKMTAVATKHESKLAWRQKKRQVQAAVS